MAACVENNQESSNALAIVPYCPVVLDVEPLSTYANSHVSWHIPSTYEENVVNNGCGFPVKKKKKKNVVNNNIILNAVPISQYKPDSKRSRKRKLRTTKVVNISYNNRFIRRVFQGKIKYFWERDGPTSNTIVQDDGFKHELLQDWIVELRIRQDGRTKERYFNHPKVKAYFRSIKCVEEFLASMIDIPNQKTTEEDKEAKKIEVERFLAESYENLMNYHADQRKP